MGACGAWRAWPALLVLAILTAGPLGAVGSVARAADAEATRAAIDAAGQAALKAMVVGPQRVELAGQATLDLPAGYGFVPKAEGAALMRAMANSADETFVGLIAAADSDRRHWLIVVEYKPSGYIKDDDAKNWNADELLKSLKDGTEAANAQRVAAGIPALVVTRWIEPPAYDSAGHRLVWSAEAKEKDGPAPDPTVNYNTYVLGREGYVSLNLLTQASTVDEDKQDAHALLERVRFNPGREYTAYNHSTDNVAAFGLAALVAGVAAKKLGLLALIGVTIVKFAKVITVAVVAGMAGVRKWLRARAQRAQPPAP